MFKKIFIFAVPAFLVAARLALATPLMSLESEDDWNDALGGGSGGSVLPLPQNDWDDYMANSGGGMYGPGLLEPPGPYMVPDLYVYESPGPDPDYPAIDGAGLVMYWGPQAPDGGSYTAAWEYVYPLDPNLTALTLNCSVVAPQFNASGGQVTSVGLGLVNMFGATRTWTWNVGPVLGPANTITYNQLWTMTIGPIAPASPAPLGPAFAVDIGGTTVAPITFSAAAFNPAMVTQIIAIESGTNVGSIPPPPGGPVIPIMWNWWQGVNVIPEPTSFALLLSAGLVAIRRRRDQSRRVTRNQWKC